MSSINEQEDSVLLQINIKPNSKESKIVKGEEITVYVRAAPVKGKANRELLRVLSEEWDISKNQITIISGHKSRKKLIKIEDITLQLKSTILNHKNQ